MTANSKFIKCKGVFFVGKERKGLHWTLILLIALSARIAVSFLCQIISVSLQSVESVLKFAFFSDCMMRITYFSLSAFLGRKRYLSSGGWRGYLLIWCVIIRSVLNIGELYNQITKVKYSYYGLDTAFMTAIKIAGISFLVIIILARIIIYAKAYKQPKAEAESEQINI